MQSTFGISYGQGTCLTDQEPRVLNLLNRMVERWQRGGIEEYSLGSLADRIPGARSWRLESGVEVSEHAIWLSRLPEAFRGFRIVQLTDIHHGRFVPLEAVVEAVELANQWEPDLVALTGDFVTFSRAYVEPVAALLGQLRARHGAFAVLGNHDFRVGADEITRALRRQR